MTPAATAGVLNVEKEQLGALTLFSLACREISQQPLRGMFGILEKGLQLALSFTLRQSGASPSRIGAHHVLM